MWPFKKKSNSKVYAIEEIITSIPITYEGGTKLKRISTAGYSPVYSIGMYCRGCGYYDYREISPDKNPEFKYFFDKLDELAEKDIEIARKKQI